MPMAKIVNLFVGGTPTKRKAFSSGEGGIRRMTDEESILYIAIGIGISSSTAVAVPLLRWRRLLNLVGRPMVAPTRKVKSAELRSIFGRAEIFTTNKPPSGREGDRLRWKEPSRILSLILFESPAILLPSLPSANPPPSRMEVWF